jgi:predicted MFS family arabinose efflux permease
VSVENRNVDLPESKEDTKSSGVSGYASVLRNPQFMCLWIAQIFSQFADRAVFVLFVAVLTTLQHSTIAGKFVGAAQMTSLLYVAFTIPAIILSPIAGVYVDRFSNKLVLVLSSLFRAATVCLIATPLVKQAPSIALSLAFLISIGSQFFAPAETASASKTTTTSPSDFASASLSAADLPGKEVGERLITLKSGYSDLSPSRI